MGFATYVLASNRLAGQYLVQVLTNDRLTHPILLEQLPQPRLRSRLTVFVVEGSTVPLPLSECIRRLRFLFPKGRFLMVDRPQPDEEIMRLIRLGFHGFVEHSKVSEFLSDAVRAIATGRLWMPDKLMEKYVSLTAEARQPHAGSPQLTTPRETEILELVRHRLSNREIASLLNVSESTVKSHLSHILAKFRAGSRRELEILEVRPSRVWEELSRTRLS